jgi:HD-GYP domain-containing protein (c-di-GMP phosphodiesterase class II)
VIAALGVASLYDARPQYENTLQRSAALSVAAANLASAGVVEEEVLRDGQGRAAAVARRQVAAAYRAAAGLANSLARGDPASERLVRDQMIAAEAQARTLVGRGGFVSAIAGAGPVRALSNAVEARDADTRKHAERVTAYGLEVARTIDGPLSGTPELEFGFLLHDVGKVAIPDAILYKPASLSLEERALMARHPVIGAEIVRGIEFLSGAAEVARHHHERWDGGGYPDGLAGENIPLAARAFAVADVLDALTTDRPYRPASPLNVARQMISAESGRQFDPHVVEAFDSIDDERLLHISAEIR